MKGPNTGFAEIALSMDLMSAIPSEIHHNLVLKRLMENQYLIENDGREVLAK